jgi:hypothetical protein
MKNRATPLTNTEVLDVVTIADLEAIEGLLGGAERFRQTGFRPVSDA